MNLSSRGARSASPGSIATTRSLAKTRGYQRAPHFSPGVWVPGSLRVPGRHRSGGDSVRYGFASLACSTTLQAAGICASVIGGFGLGGSGGGFGCSTPSLNQ